jgi:hypothetical protein
MINTLDESCRGAQNTCFMFNNCFSKIVLFYEIMWENIVEGGRPQMTIWRMRIACWITKSINTHTGCVILLAFPLQQWLRESSLMASYSTLPVLLYATIV